MCSGWVIMLRYLVNNIACVIAFEHHRGVTSLFILLTDAQKLFLFQWKQRRLLDSSLTIAISIAIL